MKKKIFLPKSQSKFYREIVLPILLSSKKNMDSGRPIPKVNLLPREVLGVYCVSLVASVITGEEYILASDPDSGDGIVYDMGRESTGFPLEQVYVPRGDGKNLTKSVLDAIVKKEESNQHLEFERGLLVFPNMEGKLDWQKIKQHTETLKHYNSYWIISRNSPTEIRYLVLLLKSEVNTPYAYQIDFNKEYERIKVSKLGNL